MCFVDHFQKLPYNKKLSLFSGHNLFVNEPEKKESLGRGRVGSRGVFRGGGGVGPRFARLPFSDDSLG